MWSFQNNIVIFLLSLATSGLSQYVTVNDTLFAQDLCKRFPLVMSADCRQLDTLKTLTEYQNVERIQFTGKGYTNIDEILYFKNVDTIYFNMHKINTFPSDISGFTSLNWLNLANNELTVLPTIFYRNELNQGYGTRHIYANNNLIDSLPPSWYSENNMVFIVHMKSNNLKNVPSFNNYSVIKRLNLIENELGFEELVPILNHPNKANINFELFPQKPFSVDIDSMVRVGQTISANIATGLSSNNYYLFKDNQVIDSTRSGVFNIKIDAESDTGQYHFRVRNDNFTGEAEYLESKRVNVKLKPSLKVINKKNVFVFSPDGDGNVDSFWIEGEGALTIYNKVGQEILTEQLPLNGLVKTAMA